jgi:hypothetical protein
VVVGQGLQQLVQVLFQMEICFQDELIVWVIVQLYTTCCWSSLTFYHDYDMCILKRFMTTLGFKKDGQISLYWNLKHSVLYIVAVEFKQSVATLISANNNTFLQTNYKCCVMYFIKKHLLLPNVLVIVYKPCEFSLTECNTFFVNHLIAWWKCVCQIYVVKVWKQIAFHLVHYTKNVILWLVLIDYNSCLCHL